MNLQKMLLHNYPEFDQDAPCKVIYLGIVAPPNKEYDFDGQNFPKHVSNFIPQKQNSHPTIWFSDGYKVNEIIRKGEW